MLEFGFTEFSDEEDVAWRFAIDDFVDEENEGRRVWLAFDIFFLFRGKIFKSLRENENLQKENWVLMARERETLNTEWKRSDFFGWFK